MEYENHSLLTRLTNDGTHSMCFAFIIVVADRVTICVKRSMAVFFGVGCLMLMAVPATAAEPMVKLTSDFPGGNVVVKENAGRSVELAPDLRGGRPWFYWYFEAEVVQPGRVTFTFADPPQLGARGPAVSIDDGNTWQWLGAEHVVFARPRQKDSPTRRVDTFSYDFSKRGQKVRFAVTIPYVQRNLDLFLKDHAANPHLTQGVLTKTLKGKPVELLQIGEPAQGRKAVLVTCRHHACESMASFAFEGFLAEAMSESERGREFRRKYVLYAVPIVDKDGVQAGDQGKNRSPHDHNRDYRPNGIYPEIAAIRELVEAKHVKLVLDFHDPLIRGESHTIFSFYGAKIPHNYENTAELSRWMKEEGPPLIPSTHVWLKPPREPDPTVGEPCANYFARKQGMLMSVTLEAPYTPPHIEFDAAMARAYGAGTLRAWSRMDFISAAPGSERGAGDIARLEAFRKSFMSLYRGKPDEAEALANVYLEDPAASALYRVEANNRMGMMQLWHKQYAEAAESFQAALADTDATMNQRAVALAQRVIVACTEPGTAAADVEKALSCFEAYPYQSDRQQYDVHGHVSSFYSRKQDYARALAHGRKRVSAASRYDRGRALVDMAALHENLGEQDEAVAARQAAVAYLRGQLDPVPVGIMGPMMAFDLLDALNGIPTATQVEKKAAAEMGLNHRICTPTLRKKITDAFPIAAGEEGLTLFEFSQAQKDYRFSRNTYIEQFEKWAKEDVGKVVDNDDVLVIGSSSIRGWRSIEEDLAPIRIIPRGFGGSRMIDVLAYKEFFRRYKAKRILLYEGDNDLGGSFELAPETFIEHCREFVDYIRETSPDTQFYFLSIKPSTGRMEKWPLMSKGNELLREYAKTDESITFVDIATPMLKDENTVHEGLIGKDGVHMTIASYQLWSDTIRPYLLKNTAK